jgi:hypothetical protein
MSPRSGQTVISTMLRHAFLFLLVFTTGALSFRLRMFEPISTAVCVASVSLKAYPLLREAKPERCISRVLPVGCKITHSAIRKNGRIPPYTQRILERIVAHKAAFLQCKILPELSEEYESDFASNCVEFLVDYADHVSNALLSCDWHHAHTLFLIHFFFFF